MVGHPTEYQVFLAMNPDEIHQMWLDDLLMAFESSTVKLRQEARKERLDWSTLHSIGYYACSVSQRIHLLICQQRRRSEMPCEFATDMFDRFVQIAASVLAGETVSPEAEDFRLYVTHIDQRREDLLELAARATKRDVSLGFRVDERQRQGRVLLAVT
jgi:hypothetical protein